MKFILKKPLLFLLFILINSIPVCAATNKTSISARVISREDNHQNGFIKYNLVIYATDTVIIDSLGGKFNYFNSISNNGIFPIFLDSADSLTIEMTLTYDSLNLPYSYKSIDNYIFSHKDSLFSSYISI